MYCGFGKQRVKTTMLDYSYSQQLTIFHKEELEQKKIEHFELKLCKSHDKIYRAKKCANCNSHFEHDKQGKPIRFLITCGSPYCQDEDCFKKRYMNAKKYFEVFFNAYKPWRTKRGSRWIHEVFGFPRIPKEKLTKEYITRCKKQLSNFLVARERDLGQKN